MVVGHTGSENLIPSIALPYFDPAILNQLLPVAFAISLLSVMESTSAAKSTAACSGQRLSMNQEIFGVGLANLSAAFFGAMPISGSPSRTTMSFEMGAKTRLAAIFNSIFALFFLFVFGFLIQHIPIAAFAALLIASAVNIVQPKQLLICLKATRADTFVLVLTILGCIFLSLDVAFYMGVILSITLYLKKSAVPQIVEYTVDKNGALVQMQKSEPRKIRFIKVEGELFFGAADIFHSMLKNIAEDDTTTQVIILQMRNARDIDATACLALKQLFEFMRSLGKHLIVCGLTHQVWETLCDSDILDTIGKENLFIYNEKEPSQSSKKALLRAYKIVGDSFETGHKDVERLKLTLQGAEVKVKHQIT